jgi:two-component system, OmpR family, response regulator
MENAMRHIIVLDADPMTRTTLAEHLTDDAFRVTGLDDLIALERVLVGQRVDALVIDVNSDEDFDTVGHLAERTSAPIIILSHSRLREDDKVRGLEAGAADYIAKPLACREFLARLRVAMRGKRTIRVDRDIRSYAFAGTTLWVRQRNLCRPGAADVKLTGAEFNLFVAFLQSPRQILSREQLLTASRVHSEEINDRSLDALILRLRRKIEIDPANPQLIRTVRGAGYALQGGDASWRASAAPLSGHRPIEPR